MGSWPQSAALVSLPAVGWCCPSSADLPLVQACITPSLQGVCRVKPLYKHLLVPHWAPTLALLGLPFKVCQAAPYMVC